VGLGFAQLAIAVSSRTNSLAKQQFIALVMWGKTASRDCALKFQNK
jgi:hypothetical protein